jgi:hypothetical protein
MFMPKDPPRSVVACPPNLAEAGRRLFSIGHSNLEGLDFLALLQRAGITVVADVRSSPFSQRYPQFNRSELERALRAQGMAYVFLGGLLGGRPPDRSLYDSDGRVNYERVRETSFFRRGLDRLIRGLERFTIAMMCSEQDPLDCHRGLMITPALAEHGIAPEHLHRDGSVESTAEMERRLLVVTGIGQGEIDGLFATQLSDDERQDLLAEAYREMARRKAFRLRPEEDGDDTGA